jgi:ribonucleoside-triphosphate reductase
MTLHSSPSARAAILFRRTYNRPLNDEGTQFETFGETIARGIDHQRWLWERAAGPLAPVQEQELLELHDLMLRRKVSTAGRTLWLGGTELVKRREASSFNCSFLDVRTCHDVVDAFWLLLQGCGVGFRPVSGALSGFTRRMQIELIRSTRTGRGGPEQNTECYDQETATWTITVGDSAEAWAKSVGKLLAGKFPARRLVLDLSPIRAPGTRLKGYGWICTGDETLAQALAAVAGILNARVGKLLSKNEIIDIVNWLGTVLSNRRSAQMAILDYGDPEWREFATRKYKGFDKGEHWFRGQSNNSLVFYTRPTRRQLKELFELIEENGGAEPGIINGAQAMARAPWFSGLNPCGEIILADKGFCNLVEVDVSAFRGDDPGLRRAMELIARANYRQTCVNLRDGVLQDAWHQQNEYLHLCGVGLTGIVRRPDLTPFDYRQLKNAAVAAAYTMADELCLERPKNVTCIKPSGTLSKALFDTTEGAHKPKGKYIFNTVSFSKYDPQVRVLFDANYRISDHPTDKAACLIVLPICYPDVTFDSWNGFEVDREAAVDQFARYRMLNRAYVEQNTSITISYEPGEVRAIIDAFLMHWDDYVACAFLYRDNPTLTAEQLNFVYLPQRAVGREEYEAYASRLRPVDIESVEEQGIFEVDTAQSECATGACPAR